MQKRTGKEAEKFIESSEKGMKNIRPIEINSLIDGRSGPSKTDFSTGKVKNKKQKIRNPHKKIPKILKKHGGISSGFCTKNILFCTNSEKFCTKA